MMEFLSIVLLVFGVLQIILFFKLWGMTNDVKKIKERLEKKDWLCSIMTGDKENAYGALLQELYAKLKECAQMWNGGCYTEKAGELIESYRKKIEETGHKLPEYMSTPDKFKDNYYRIKNI